MKIWKVIGKILLGILTAVGTIFIVVKVRKAVLGVVKSKERVSWTRVPNDRHKIAIIKKNGSTVIRQLPDGVEFKDIVAAGTAENNKIIVEVKHDKIDKRNPSPVRDDNAFDALRSRVHPNDSGRNRKLDEN